MHLLSNYIDAMVVVYLVIGIDSIHAHYCVFSILFNLVIVLSRVLECNSQLTILLLIQVIYFVAFLL